MSLRFIVLAAALLPIVAAPAGAGKHPFVDGESLEFKLTDLGGQPVSSSDQRFAGKVVLVDLWATWCPPCITEIPTLIDLQERFDEGLMIVAIAFEKEPDPDRRRGLLNAFVAENRINYLILDGGTPEEFASALPDVRNVKGFPVEILIDRAGRVVKTRNSYGYKKRWAKRLDRDVRELLDSGPD